jgi:hypothetical protein
MARRKRLLRKTKYPPYDPPIWVEGYVLNERTGKLEPVRYKLRNKCN